MYEKAEKAERWIFEKLKSYRLKELNVNILMAEQFL